MRFEPLKLAHLGSTAEDGVSLIDEIEIQLNDLAHLCVNEMYGDKARLDISISIDRSGEDGVLVDAKVKCARPRRKRKALMAYLNQDGSLMTQKAEQLALPIKRKPRLTQEEIEASMVAGETAGTED